MGSVNTSMDENVNIKANYTAKYMMEENSRKADIPLTVDSEDPMSISRLAKIHIRNISYTSAYCIFCIGNN